ncbi:MAG: signal peptidase II [Clostridiales bacterium]|nr:signal peptidase II [Clostridiales bacterium]
MVVMIGIAAAIVALDLIVKQLAESSLAGSNLAVIEGVLEFRLTRNSGMALGIMSGNTIAIIVLPLVVIVLGYLLLRHYEQTRYMHIAVGMVLGGFLGNFVERVFNGYVVDMIYFPFMPWFICNIADIFICIGVALLACSLLFRPQDWSEKNAKENNNRQG